MAVRGRKNLYNKLSSPKSAKALCIKGFSNKQIAELLGISEISFYKWKERYPEFKKAVDEGKDQINEEVVGALFKKTKGYYYYERIFEPENQAVFTKSGKKRKQQKGVMGRKPSKPKMICVRKIKKYAQPDQRSIEFWLTNKDKANWKLMTQVDGNIKQEYIVTPPVNPLDKKEKE